MYIGKRAPQTPPFRRWWCASHTITDQLHKPRAFATVMPRMVCIDVWQHIHDKEDARAREITCIEFSRYVWRIAWVRLSKRYDIGITCGWFAPALSWATRVAARAGLNYSCSGFRQRQSCVCVCVLYGFLFRVDFFLSPRLLCILTNLCAHVYTLHYDAIETVKWRLQSRCNRALATYPTLRHLSLLPICATRQCLRTARCLHIYTLYPSCTMPFHAALNMVWVCAEI